MGDQQFFSGFILFAHLVYTCVSMDILPVVPVASPGGLVNQKSPVSLSDCHDDVKSLISQITIERKEREKDKIERRRVEQSLLAEIRARKNLEISLKNSLENLTASVLNEVLKREKNDRKTSDIYGNASPRDCLDLLNRGHNRSGVYVVYPPDTASETGFSVYCDMTSDGGGWLVFQRRSDGSIDFFRDWKSYEQGFGPLTGEFWLGNYKLYLLTSQCDYELRIDMADFISHQGFAKYDHFDISGPLHQYKLNISGFYGSTSPAVGDSLTSPHNGSSFHTKDRDVNECAAAYKGGWWYNNCHNSNLNGLYLGGPHPDTNYAEGIEWESWKGYYYSLKSTEMKIRPSRPGRAC